MSNEIFTEESVMLALGHVDAWNGPGRLQEAVDMLVPVTQAIANKAAEEGELPACQPELRMVSMRLRQMLDPKLGTLSAQWHAADALYWLTGDEGFVDRANKLQSEHEASDRAARNDDDEAIVTVSRSNTDDSLIFTPLRDFSVTDGMKLYDRAARPVANKAQVEPLGYITEDGMGMLKAGRPVTVSVAMGNSSAWCVPIYATPPSTTGASTVLTDERLRRGLQALLQCTASELDDYSPKLMDGYEEDVRRVHSALVAAQAGQVAVPELMRQAVATVVSRAGDNLRIGWLRPERCEVGTLLYCAAPSPAIESLRSPQEAAGTEKGARDA